MATREHQETFQVEEREGRCRVDTICSQNLPNFSRTLSDQEDTQFFINGNEVKKAKKVKSGDMVTIKWVEHFFDDLTPQNIPLDVLYEDDAVLVINKGVGLVVHPGSGNWDNTIANALVYRYGEAFQEEHSDEKMRPGIVHRLDKDTSGVLLIAKTAQALDILSTQFKERKTDKYYIALVEGFFDRKRGSIRSSLMRDEKDRQKFTATQDITIGKSARTDYLVLKQFANCALVRIHLYTGRTHQIRVHLQSIGHPIIGDTIYNKHSNEFPLLLHALSLSFDHPDSSKRMKIIAPMPQRFKEAIKGFR